MRAQKTRLNFLIPISLVLIFGAMLVKDIITGSLQSLSIIGFVWGILELGFYIVIIKTEGKNYYYFDERVKYSFLYGESWGFIVLTLIILGIMFYNTMFDNKIVLKMPTDFLFLLVIGFIVRTIVVLIYRYKDVTTDSEAEME